MVSFENIYEAVNASGAYSTEPRDHYPHAEATEAAGIEFGEIDTYGNVSSSEG